MTRYIIFGLTAAWGCATGSPAVDPTTEANILSYAAQELQCVDLAGTRAVADSCIAQTRARWCGPGGPLYDAGACRITMLDAGAVTYLDAGAQ